MIALLASCLLAPCLGQDLIPWQRNLVNAKSGARNSDMLIFAEFVDTKDELSVKADQLTFVGSDVQRKLANFIPVKVEPTDTLAWKQYNVKRGPLVYVIDAKGAVRGHFSMPIDPAELARQIDLLVQCDRNFIRNTNQALNGTVNRQTLTHAALGFAYRLEFAEANAIIEELKARGIPNEVMQVMGQGYAMRGGTKTALYWYELALKSAPNPGQRNRARRGVAEAATALGDTNKATKHWQDILTDSKASPADKWKAQVGLDALSPR